MADKALVLAEDAMQRRFHTLDVFTDRPFTGNPLAVVLEPDGLDTAAMQAIAKEFNLSETVFVLPPENQAHRARLRIFTPMREMPFAGHPTVGTAVLLGCLDGGSNERDLVLEENIGPVPCRVGPSERGGYASFDLPALPWETGPAPPAGEIAAALGLSEGDIGFGGFQPSRWSAGNEFIFAPIASLDAVRRASPAGAAQLGAVFLFSGQTEQRGHDFHARMFAQGFGVREDPATGSAVAAFAGVVARHGGLKDGTHKLAIEQGFEMGRPSLIDLAVSLSGGKATAASIGGNAVMVSEGTIEA